MSYLTSRSYQTFPINLQTLAGMIADTQRPSGDIPWSTGDKTDPWDHVEAAMGLTIGGLYTEARRAFVWLAEIQLSDGSWYAAYRNGQPEDTTRDTNLSAYIAVGLWHYFLVTRDRTFLKRLWPTVSAAIDFATGLQAPGGQIYWALNPQGKADRMALLTGSSSVYMSIRCALMIAETLGHVRPDWESAMLQLETAIRCKPQNFNMTKSRFAMDWFYPVLCGALQGETARQRIRQYWNKFIIAGQGVRCVSDQPWVTIAETAELCLALQASGDTDLALIIYGWISDKRYDDGSFWCGYTFPDMVIWPEEKITWTNAVVLMAADALYNLTPASRLFEHQPQSGDRHLNQRRQACLPN